MSTRRSYLLASVLSRAPLGGVIAVATAAVPACSGSAATPTEAPEGIETRSWDLFYRTASADLGCDAYELEVERVGGYTFSAKGCGGEIFYGVFFEPATGSVILSDASVRRNASELVGSCPDDPPAVYYYDDYHRNVHGCGKVVIVGFKDGGWRVDPDAKPPI